MVFRVVYNVDLRMPQKVMASPTNVFDFYDTYTYDVINLNPGEYAPSIAADRASVELYTRRYGPFNPNTLRFVHFSNRSVVEDIENFIPMQRQVSGPPGQPDIGFRMMDDLDPRNFSHQQPVIASGEKYYVRVSGAKGSPFFDIYAPYALPAAFNVFRSIRSDVHAMTTPGGSGDRFSHLLKRYSYANPRRRHEIVSTVNRLSVYFSTKGAVTNLHFDESGDGTVVCQLKGAKRFQLWPPDGHDVMRSHRPQSHPLSRRSMYDGRDPVTQSHALAMRRTHDITIQEGMCIFFPRECFYSNYVLN